MDQQVNLRVRVLRPLAAERALDLLGRGPFLADEPDADWALPPRREAEHLTARCRHLAWAPPWPLATPPAPWSMPGPPSPPIPSTSPPGAPP